MKGKSRSIVVAAALLALGFVAGAVAGDPVNKGIVQWALADLKWQAASGAPTMVVAASSAPNGSHCDFSKFPKGTKVPLHTHTADISAVVLAGQFGSAEEGKAVKPGGPGSYVFIPGGLKHTTECGADADCIIFDCQPGAFDLAPVGAGKK
jgi:quercetin dioxygenase-like cupin family protein